MSIPNFGDLVTRKPLEGEKKKLEEIQGQPVIVTAARVTKSKFQNGNGSGKCATVQFYFEDDEAETKYVLFTGSGVISDQLEEIMEKLEERGADIIFRTTFIKCGKYYAMS